MSSKPAAVKNVTLACEWPSCGQRGEEVRLFRAEEDAKPVAVCELHANNVLGVSS